MNKILASLAAVAALATASSAFAADIQTLATYQVGLGQNDAGRFVIAAVTLKSDGTMTIARKLVGGVATDTDPSLTTVSTTLSSETFDLVKTKVEELANVDIATTHSTIVCMMMPMAGTASNLSVARNYDYDTASFKGALTVIDNNAGCWAATHIQPKEAYDVTTAKTLEAQLQVLASQATAGIN